MAKTANELWFDALVRHQVYLMRVSGGIRNDINGLLNATERVMVDRIHAVLAGKTTLSPARLRKAESLIKQLKQIRTEVWIEIDGLWRETLEGLTVQEVERVNHILQTVSPAELSTQLPTANKLKSLVKTLPFEGRTLGSWAKKVAADDIGRISSQIRIGIVQGETTQSIARRIIGTAKLKGVDGVTQITRRNAEAITRTAVNSFSNASRSAYFAENDDLFDTEVFVATLDGRTTPICRSLDGDRFPVGEGSMPPMHFSCRSLRVAEINGQVVGMRPAKSTTERMMVKKYAQANGLGPIRSRVRLPRGHKGKYDVFARGEMRRMTGRVPAKVTYGEWLKGQSVEFQDDVLGPTRGKLFRKGGLTLDKFVDKKGATIRLDQLAETDAAAFKAAGLAPKLTTAEIEAIQEYTLRDYVWINEYQRHGTISKAYGLPEKLMKDRISKIESATNKLTKFDGTTYRGLVIGGGEKGLQKFLRGFPKDSVIESTSFWSTSKDLYTAKQFTKQSVPGLQRMMVTIKGKSGSNLTKDIVSGVGATESEVLYKKGTRFNVLSVSGDNIVLEEI